MNRTVKEATVKRYHYESHEQLETHLQLFVDAYNHARPIKALRGFAPYEAVCRTWTKTKPVQPRPVKPHPGTEQLVLRLYSLRLLDQLWFRHRPGHLVFYTVESRQSRDSPQRSEPEQVD